MAEDHKRKKKVPEFKVKLVKDITARIKNKRTLLIASTKGLPSSHFHQIKKDLRSVADIKVEKKNSVFGTSFQKLNL